MQLRDSNLDPIYHWFEKWYKQQNMFNMYSDLKLYMYNYLAMQTLPKPWQK